MIKWTAVEYVFHWHRYNKRKKSQIQQEIFFVNSIDLLERWDNQHIKAWFSTYGNNLLKCFKTSCQWWLLPSRKCGTTCMWKTIWRFYLHPFCENQNTQLMDEEEDLTNCCNHEITWHVLFHQLRCLNITWKHNATSINSCTWRHFFNG
jgi:hypothetical protein